MTVRLEEVASPKKRAADPSFPRNCRVLERMSQSVFRGIERKRKTPLGLGSSGVPREGDRRAFGKANRRPHASQGYALRE